MSAPGRAAHALLCKVRWRLPGRCYDLTGSHGEDMVHARASMCGTPQAQGATRLVKAGFLSEAASPLPPVNAQSSHNNRLQHRRVQASRDRASSPHLARAMWLP